ncbi:MAG: nuclear transport factor 2 family protein, partial [Sphingorhabdus sp.]
MRGKTLRLITVGALTFLCAPVSAESAIKDLGDYSKYVAVFNAADPSFVNYYSPDVVFDKGPPDGILKGRSAISAWYADIWQDFGETLTPLTVVIDTRAGVMMVELRTELRARRDGIVWRDRTYRKGDL